MKSSSFLFSFLLIISHLHTVSASEIMTPVGVVKIPCLQNSDTIVGLPTRQNAAFEGSISAAPDTTTISGSAILTLAGSPGLTTNQFAGDYYVKFKNSSTPAIGDGQWFTVTANGSATITVNLNGGSIDAVSGADLEVLKFWTLDELFPPSECTTDASTTGNAIAASSSTNSTDRQTELLYPDLISNGINLAASATYFVHDGTWKKDGGGDTDFGGTQLWPDVYFTIRNGSNVSAATTYVCIGEVELGDFDLPLSTQTSGRQDNFIGIPRPLNITFDELNLGGSSAFVTSTSDQPTGRKDQILVFDNTQAALNKSSSETYFYYSGAWRKVSNTSVDSGGDIIPKGAGFIIRKAPTVDGATHIWKNTPSYSAP